MQWIQIWVEHPTADAVQVMKHIDPYLQMFGAVPCAPDGIPIKDADNTIEVRAFGGIPSATMAKLVLEDNGFVIVREQVND